MKQVTRRILALILAAVMVFALAACTQNANNESSTSAGTDGKPFSSDTEISIVVGSHASWPYDANWKMWQYFKEGSGANLQVQSIGTEFDTKVNLMMSSPDTLPDLLCMDKKTTVDTHASSGAFISISDNLDKMPNFTKFYDSIDATEKESLFRERTSADGKVYFAPVYGTTNLLGAQGWLYRKDIFEKNNLEAPKTYDDLYNVCKKLKEIYPDSYPFCPQGGFGVFTVMGPAFKPYMDYGVYYDYTKNSWEFGAIAPEMKELVEFLVKMKHEGLIQPTVLSMDSSSYDEFMTTDKTFITCHYLVRQAYYNVPMKKNNPDYNLSTMVPPAANNATGRNKMARTSINTTGYVVCNTGKQDRIDNALKLLDWMYTDQAAELLSWGKKDETYTEKDGDREFILGEGETVQLKYGTATAGLLQRMDPDAYNKIVSSGSPIDMSIFDYTEDYVNPMRWIALNEEEQEIYNKYYDALFSYTSEVLSKFVMEQQDLSTWDNYVATVKSMGLDELMGAYKSAWARVEK